MDLVLNNLQKLIIPNQLTNFLKNPNFRVCPFLAHIVRDLMIDFLLLVTQPSIRFTGSGSGHFITNANQNYNRNKVCFGVFYRLKIVEVNLHDYEEGASRFIYNCFHEQIFFDKGSQILSILMFY